MKKPLLLLILVCSAFYSLAQKPLTNSRLSSAYTYFYRLDDATTIHLLDSKHPELKDEALKDEVARYPTDHPRFVALPPGNYARVTVAENKLKYYLIQRRTANLMLFERNTDLRFVLLDSLGKEINDAVVYYGNKKLPFDAQLQLYHSKLSKKDTLIKVVYNGISNFYCVDQPDTKPYAYNPRYDNADRKKTLIGRVWVGMLWPFKQLVALIKPESKYYEPSPGFMVFNKPKYRPGDTVKFKAFILQRKSKLPIANQRLVMQLRSSWYENEAKNIGYVNAYRKGAFEGQFKLTDSLGLVLDRDYILSLENIDNKPAPAKKTPLSNDEFMARAARLRLIESRFKYEDYELKANKLEVRQANDAKPGDPTTLYIKATDDNGLNVPDGRIKVILQTSSATDYNADHVFIPDTLWQSQLPLDPLGETKLVIPDSIFPKAKIAYQAIITFLNSNNESQTNTQYLTRDYQDKKIITGYAHDTVKVDYRVAGKSQPAKGTLISTGWGGDTLSIAAINLPARIPPNKNVFEYYIKVGDLRQPVSAENWSFQPVLSGYRTTDSLVLRSENPAHIKFWYAIYKGKKIYEQGVTTQLNYNKLFSYSGKVNIVYNSIQNVYAQSNQLEVPFTDKYLNIDVKQPFTVYPGQRATIEVDVKDSKGKPVANADITAYSITSKFEHFQLPVIPYLGKEFAFERFGTHLSLYGLKKENDKKLNWEYWRKAIGLDSIKYFQFTHPDDVFQVEETAPDTVTQVAPFIVKDGNILPVHILYIDDKPVYFNQTEDLQRYSFRIHPGLHYFRFRTTKQLIKLDNIEVAAGKKLILSVNADSVKNKRAQIKKMPDTLMNYEADLINQYLITVASNFGSRIATLEQNDRLFLINNNLYGTKNIYDPNRYYDNFLVGPLDGSTVKFDVKNSFSRRFTPEPGYTYSFTADLLKQKSIPSKYPFKMYLQLFSGNTNYKQYALTNNAVDSIWQDYKYERGRNANYTRSYFTGGGKLIVMAGKLKNGNTPEIANIIVYKKDDMGFVQIFSGNSTDLGSFEPGIYRVFYLLKKGLYYLQENVIVKAHGINFYNTGIIDPRAPDSVSVKIQNIIEDERLGNIDERASNQIREVFNDKFLELSVGKGEIAGRVFDAVTKEPLVGTTVVSAGKGLIQADANGFFKIKASKKMLLAFTNIGYIPQTLTVTPGKIIKVYLTESVQNLHETVIRGYVKRNRDESTGSSYVITGSRPQMLLQGKVAGLNIQNNIGAPGMRGSVNIRGLADGPTPLYVVDGVIVSSDNFKNLSQDAIADMSILKDNAATAIYGKQGANGVIVITTKKAADQSGAVAQLPNIRHNFSDYAYWQPKLTTNEQGKAKFNVTYPDDITNWRTIVIGITDKRQSGMAEGQVKSFKPVSANFVSPLFAVRGDTFSPLGKVLNYTTDTLKLKRKFSYNGKPIAEGDVITVNSHIDTFKLVADGKDSLDFEYTIKRDNGYFDGEKRTIPLYEQGSLETKGTFDVLDKDTTVRLQFDPHLKDVTIHAEASAFPVLLDETEHLRTYEYLCNEQLASKLKALLAEKQIRSYLKEPFKWDKDINEIIKKLMDTRNQQGTWGWWKDTPEELWISQHVTEALLTADSRGFKVQLNKQQLIDYLVYRLTVYNESDKLTDIALLKTLGSNANLQDFVRDYEKNLSPKIAQRDIDKYRLMLTRQIAGMPVIIDTLLKKMKHTAFGNVYWGTQGYNLFNNQIQQSLLAYHILKNDGHHAALLSKLRNYFMEQRSAGYWRNTYESAEILETILPDMLVGGQKPSPASLTISGDKSATITTFPYTATLPEGGKLNISKTGDMPVYLTTYQKAWNPDPKKVDGDFSVDTWFQKGTDVITKVKGGEAVTLMAKVTAKVSADFVMIEIPIPAGCSYDGKEQSYYENGEVHREYFKNKVSIFCRKLSDGKYTFKVKLMPRYSGTYHLNPAKAEIMYFPVFNGREGMKLFNIE